MTYSTLASLTASSVASAERASSAISVEPSAMPVIGRALTAAGSAGSNVISSAASVSP